MCVCVCKIYWNKKERRQIEREKGDLKIDRFDLNQNRFIIEIDR